VVRRLSGRRVCVKGQHNFHVEYDPPKHSDRCDVDGSRLVVREDDQPDVVQHRLEEYHEKTEPLIGYYEKQGILRRIDGARSADEVHDQIRATLASLRFEEQV
jgi:adenylate kinase